MLTRKMAALLLLIATGLAIYTNFRNQPYSGYEQFLEAAIKGNPGFAMYYDMRGSLHQSEGRHREALKDYSRAIEINPDKVTFRLQRGTLFASLKMFEQAYGDFSHVIRTHPGEPNAWYLRGSLLGELKRYEEAIADFNRYIDLRSENKVSDISDTITGTFPPDIGNQLPTAYNNRAVYHYYLGNYTAALEDALNARKSGYPVSQSFFDSVQVRLAGKKDPLKYPD